MRTFISIELPNEIKKNIEKLVEELKLMLTPIKWVERKNLHLTLKFLGWVEDKKIDALSKSILGVCKGFGTFRIGLKGLGVFPDARHPRVIWTGVTEGGKRIKELAVKLEEKLSGQGYREEEREYSAHLTVGRIKEKIDVSALSEFIDDNTQRDLGSFTVKNVSLMKSTLSRSGPTYEEVKRIKLTPS